MKPITLTLTLKCRGNISKDVTDGIALNLANYAADMFGGYVEDRPEVEWTTRDVPRRPALARPVLAWPTPERT